MGSFGHIVLVTLFASSTLVVESSERDKRQITFGGSSSGGNRRPQRPLSVGNGGVNFGDASSQSVQSSGTSLSTLLGDDGIQTRLSPTTRTEGSSCVTPQWSRRRGPQEGTCSFINDNNCRQTLRRIQRFGANRRVLNYLRQAIQSPCGFDRTDYTLCCPGRVREQTTRRPTITSRPTTTRRPTISTTSRPDRFQSCGFSPFSVRIVGGREASQGSWPWAAVLGQPSGSNFQVVCGGSLIDSTHVLSAAHCFPNSAITHVRLGEHDVRSTSDGAQPQDIFIQSTKIHEQWDSQSLKNDIAILTLSRPVSFTSTILPICLPQGLTGSNLLSLPQPFIIGWGSNSTNTRTVNALRQAPIDLVSQAECDQAYGDISRVTIGNDQVCAGNGRIDTCTGDSGGPIQSQINNKWTILGITSFGVGCAREAFPGVYTRVDNFLSWIQTNT